MKILKMTKLSTKVSEVDIFWFFSNWKISIIKKEKSRRSLKHYEILSEKNSKFICREKCFQENLRTF